MYALVIVSCLASSMVAENDFDGYNECVLTIPKEATYTTAVECQAELDAAADAAEPPLDQRVFLFCIGDR